MGIGDAGVAGAFALIGGFAGSWLELRKLDRERMVEREQGFELAQTGYSECYRKFLSNIAVYQADPDAMAVSELLENFREAAFAGDPVVAKELKRYWSASARSTGDAPAEAPPQSLEEAMEAHCTRSLQQHLKLKRQHP
jgi:hypothetical protein